MADSACDGGGVLAPSRREPTENEPTSTVSEELPSAAEVLDRDAKVLDRDAEVLDRDAEVLDRDKVLDRNAEVLDRDKVLDRDAEVLDRDKVLDRDAEVLDRDKVLDRDAEVLDRDTKVSDKVLDRDAEVLDRDKVLDRDTKVSDKVLDRDAAVLDRDKVLDRDTKVSDRDAAVLDRDAAVLDRDAAVLDRDAEVLDRDTEVLDRDKVLDKDAEVLDRDAEVSDKVLDRDAEVLDRDKVLDIDAELLDTDAEVLDRDAEVLDRDAEVLDRDAEVLELSLEVSESDTEEPTAEASETDAKATETDAGVSGTYTEASKTDAEFEISDGESAASECSLSQWQPRVSLLRLPVSLQCPQRPRPSCLLDADVSLDEISRDTRSLPDDIIPLSPPDSPLAVQLVSCSACRLTGASIVCLSCGRGFHQDCHVPPVRLDIMSDWMCSLCQDLTDPSDPFLAHRPQRPAGPGLSPLNQRRCEKLLLLLKVKASSQLCQTRLDGMTERLTRGAPGYQTAADFLSDVRGLFHNASPDDVFLNKLQEKMMCLGAQFMSGEKSIAGTSFGANDAPESEGSKVTARDREQEVMSYKAKLKETRKRLREALIDTFHSKKMKMDLFPEDSGN